MDADLFRRITAPLPECHLVVEPDSGRIIAANRAAARKLGLSQSEDRSFYDLVRLDVATTREYLAACARTGSLLPGTVHLPGLNGGARRFRCEGARLALEGVRAVVLRAREHDPVSDRFLLLNRKIEELNREIQQRQRAEAELRDQANHLEELAVELEMTIEQVQQQKDDALLARSEAERASRAKSEFLAVMSHELRTPLNAILGHTDLLDAGVRGPLSETQRAQLERVRSNALQLLDMIQQILVFSHVDAGKARLIRERLDLSRLVHDAGELIRPLAVRKNLALEVAGPGKRIEIDSDRAKLNQIVQNLLSNAVKFTDRGTIAVNFEARRGGVSLSVRDTGPGIPPDDLNRIFEPFTQLDPSRTRVAGGVGLGLAVARELARALGGEIHVESTVGEGSCFTLRLPMH